MERPRSLFRDGVEIRLGIFKNFWSATTHFAGFLAAIVGLITLLVLCKPSPDRLTSASIYGGALVLLFAASSAYHFFDIGERGNRWLQRIDHMCIYLLIAGTYVPALVLLLEGAWRITLLSIVGAFAAGGILLKLFWLDCPKWLSTSYYVAFGWFGVIPLLKMAPLLSPWATFWLVAGGLSYTVGALIFQKEWPDPWPSLFGHHEIWHLMVLGGATSHYFFVMGLLI